MRLSEAFYMRQIDKALRLAPVINIKEHPSTITCLEIDNGKIYLIKWAACADENQYIHICRYILSGPENFC